VKLADPKFWNATAKKEGVVLTDGSLQYVLLDHTYQLHPIVRSKEELFVDTLRRDGAGMKVVVNGSYYDVTVTGKVDAVVGNDPVDAKETTVLGQVVRNGRVITGSPYPDRFYFGQRLIPSTATPWTYVADKGNPPADATMVAAIGGVGPLVVGALKYGVGNAYVPGTKGPETGDPGALRPSLLQRNDNTFRSVSAKPDARVSGKTVVASSTARGKLLVAVQPHGSSPGQTYAELADWLLNRGFDHAVFMDGSDSATLMVDGFIRISPAALKNSTNVLGVGFRK